MSRAIWPVIGALGVALAALVVAAVIRVGRLEAHELEAVSAWQTAREASGGGSRARLIDARLLRGDDVTFELCARDAMDGGRWSAAGSLAVVRTDRAEEMFALAIDPALLASAARSTEGACLAFAQVRGLAIDEPEVPVAIELRREGRALDDVPIRARIVARRALGSADLGHVLAILGLAIALVLALAAAPAREGRDEGSRGALRAGVGALAVIGAALGLGAFAPGGPTGGLVAGLALAALEVAIAIALVRARSGARRAALGMARAPERGVATAAWLLLAPGAGIVLFVIAQAALRLVPSTGEAPVEVFVRWPSGMLSFAALAVIAPIAEEVFFRGFVYGALRGDGGVRREAWAIGASFLLFGIAHAPQDWGNWGGLAAVLAAGLGFTLLRAASGAALAPCVAHLVYNGLLATSALAAGAS